MLCLRRVSSYSPLLVTHIRIAIIELEPEERETVIDRRDNELEISKT